jgi:dephospho-CoA kinase
VIGVSGRICAGKTTVARILEQQGFAYTRFSLVIDDEIAARGESLDRATRQRIGGEIHRTKGQRWLCEKVLELVAGGRIIVIDGLRFPEDHAFFAERFGSNFVHLHIKAPDELRALRYGESEQGDMPFAAVDQQPVEAKIDKLNALADVKIANGSSIGALRQNVLNSVKELLQRQGGECLFQSS